MADQIAIDEIHKNPELFEIYKDHEILKRPDLPTQKKFVDYLRSQTSVKELSENIDVKKTTIEHWFRYDKGGFSYPTIEDWEAIKPFLKELKFDKELASIEEPDIAEDSKTNPSERLCKFGSLKKLILLELNQL